MFGMKMQIENGKLGVLLRPLTKEDLPAAVKGFSSMQVHRHTDRVWAETLENEEGWYEKMCQSEKDVIWAITLYNPQTKKEIDDTDMPIGVTGIHQIGLSGGCVTGIIIWEPNWWGKGVASLAHLARTLYAADYLNRTTITTYIRAENEASLKAVGKVGYIRTGRELRSGFVAGRYTDGYVLAWFHPEKIDLLYPDGFPETYSETLCTRIENGLKRAREALALAQEQVIFP